MTETKLQELLNEKERLEKVIKEDEKQAFVLKELISHNKSVLKKTNEVITLIQGHDQQAQEKVVLSGDVVFDGRDLKLNK
jgi:CHASE3 domain sensor protein